MKTVTMTMIGLLTVALCSFGRAEDSARERFRKLTPEEIEDAMRAFKEMKRYSAQDYADANKPILVMDGVEIGAAVADRIRLPAAVRLSASHDAGFWLSVNAMLKETENSDGYFRPLNTLVYCSGYRPVVREKLTDCSKSHLR